MRTLIPITLLLALSGCSMFRFGGGTAAPPTAPMRAEVQTRKTVVTPQTDAAPSVVTTVETRVRVIGDENSQGKSAFGVSPEGEVTFNTAGSRELKIKALLANPLMVGCLGLVVVGVLLLIANLYPPLDPLIPDLAAWYCIGAGVGLAVLGSVVEGIREHFIALLLLVGIPGGLLGWYEFQHRKARNEEGSDVQGAPKE